MGSPNRGDIWDVDRLNHLHDLPRHCPDCGQSLADNGGMATEYWRADQRIYHVWCRSCGWTGDISRLHRMIGPDSPH